MQSQLKPTGIKLTPELKDRISEVVESWEEYQQDGLHITQSDMNNWLSSWGTPNETECSPCHK